MKDLREILDIQYLQDLIKAVNVKKVLQVMVTIMALMLLVFVSAFVTLKIMTWGKTVDVPDIRNKVLADVVNELGGLGLEVNVERQEYHPSVPAGAVIYQDPAPGSTVKKGRGVAVVVSLGSQEVKVPRAKGDAFKRFQLELKQAGLLLGETARIDAPCSRNTVVAQYPPEGTVLQKGSSVDLLVCNGPEPPRFVAPELVGKSLREAEQSANSMALRLVSGGTGSTIVSQNPEPGMQITAGGTLYVTMGRM